MTSPQRPEPLVLTVPPAMQPGTESFLFVSKTMGWMGQAEEYMGWLEARIAELEAIPSPPPLPPEPPPAEPLPQITVTEKPVAPWMDAVLAPITTNIDTELDGMRRAMLTYSYKVVSKADFLKVVEYWRRTAQPLWWELFKAEDWADVCDWWSWAFRGWVIQTFQLDSIGFVVDNGSHHSYNFIPYENGAWELFDPQYNAFAEVGTTGHGFKTGILVM